MRAIPAVAAVPIRAHDTDEKEKKKKKRRLTKRKSGRNVKPQRSPPSEPA